MKELNKLIKGGLLSVLLVLVLVPTLNASSFEEDAADGKITYKSVEPSTLQEANAYLEDFGEVYYPGYYIDVQSCNEAFTKCIVKKDGMGNESYSKEVEIEYVYDSAIKKVVDNLLINLKDGADIYYTDLENMAYFIKSALGEEEINKTSYSSEFKKLMDYNNFEFSMRAGSLPIGFTEENGGFGKFMYNGTIYGVSSHINFISEDVIYIDSDATDVVKAIKDRLSVFGDVITGVEKTDIKVIDYLEEEFGSIYEGLGEYMKNSYATQGLDTKEKYVNNEVNRLYLNDNAPFHNLVSDNAEEYAYGISIGEGIGKLFVVIKDSSKVNNDLGVITVDAETGIKISTTSKSIPLDTLISVARITDGEEYNKIVKLLNTQNSEIFDLKLYSKSENSFISKLTDGTFEVTLPISDKLKGKSLAVYYVGEDDKITEYKVTIDGDYAKFTTDHFSIYTLAEIASPKTYDSTIIYIIMFIASVFGISTVFAFKKSRS